MKKKLRHEISFPHYCDEEQLKKIIKHITHDLEWSECVNVSTIDYRNSKAKYVDRFFEGTELINNPKN
tara:strand:+ start:437 stop:640 length:204 start_codon:yes stop_codon:yes gene_type:complete